MVTDQISVQRYLTATSLKECQRALWLKLAVTLPLVSLFYLTGTVLYGYYHTFPEREPVLIETQERESGATPRKFVVAREECDAEHPPQPIDAKHRERLLRSSSFASFPRRCRDC